MLFGAYCTTIVKLCHWVSLLVCIWCFLQASWCIILGRESEGKFSAVGAILLVWNFMKKSNYFCNKNSIRFYQPCIYQLSCSLVRVVQMVICHGIRKASSFWLGPFLLVCLLFRFLSMLTWGFEAVSRMHMASWSSFFIIIESAWRYCRNNLSRTFCIYQEAARCAICTRHDVLKHHRRRRNKPRKTGNRFQKLGQKNS